MGLWDTVEFAHMALRLVPEILNPVDVILLVGEQLRVVDPEVMEVRHIKHVVAPPTVRIDDAVRHDLARHDREQSCRRRIGNYLRVNLPTTLK